MNGFNRVTIMGTVGKDAEVKALDNGNAVANVSLAVNESYTDKNTGEKREKTEWIRIEAWKGLANFLGQYGKKGTVFLIEGKLKTDSYDKDGVTQYSTKVLAENIMFAGNRPAAQQPAAQQPAYAQQPAAQQPAYAQQPAAQPAYAQQPVAQQPVAQQPVAQQPAYQEAAQQVNQFVTQEQFVSGMSNTPDDMPF